MLRCGVRKLPQARVVLARSFANDGTTTDFKDDYGLGEIPVGGKNANMLAQPVPENVRKREREVSQNWKKKTTGLTGLFVNEAPRHSLTVVYGRIMRLLALMPDDYKYRQHTESILKHRMQIVQDETDPDEIERKIGMGQVEELVMQAEHELECARILLQHKAWEPLVGKPPPGQWNWPA